MRRQRGVTLVELLVTLAVVGVLLGVVFPGFSLLIERNSMTTAANSMVVAISYARSEALQGGGAVRVLATDPSDGSNEWGPGWQVERDTGSDWVVLRVFEPISAALTFDAGDGTTELRFNNQGMLVGNASRALDLCLAGDSGVQVSVAPTGRAATSRLGVSECPAGS